MESYINDRNNVENIANGSTVLNQENVSNLVYKVDELQEQANGLKNYNHITSIANSKDSWADKGWYDVFGISANDYINYLQNRKSIRMIAEYEESGVHLEKELDLSVHTDGWSSGNDDYICFWFWINSTNLAKFTSNSSDIQVTIAFYNDFYGVYDNHFYYTFTDMIQAGSNFIKIKKSEFTEIGTPDWSSIKGIDINIMQDSTTDPDGTIYFCFDMIILAGKDFLPIVLKESTENVTSSTTLQNDDELNITLPPNGIFEIDANLIVYSTSSLGDFKCAWTISGDLALVGYRHTKGPSVNTTNALDTVMNSACRDLATANIFGVDNTRYSSVNEKFLISTSKAGGTLQLQWAQNNSNEYATQVVSGSYIKTTQLR